MLNARTQRIFFIWGAKKNVNAEKWKEHWWAGKSIYTSSPLFKDEYPICIPIWIMFSSLYTRFSVRAYLRVNLVCDTNGSGDCKYYHIHFKTCLNDWLDVISVSESTYMRTSLSGWTSAFLKCKENSWRSKREHHFLSVFLFHVFYKKLDPRVKI